MDETSAHSPAARYAALLSAFGGRDGVTIGTGKKGFGSDALAVHSKIFAMLVSGALVFKLPRQRVEALVASGAGTPFTVGANGKPMREWIALAPNADIDILALAEEALAFVGQAS